MKTDNILKLSNLLFQKVKIEKVAKELKSSAQLRMIEYELEEKIKEGKKEHSINQLETLIDMSHLAAVYYNNNKSSEAIRVLEGIINTKAYSKEILDIQLVTKVNLIKVLIDDECWDRSFEMSIEVYSELRNKYDQKNLSKDKRPLLLMVLSYIIKIASEHENNKTLIRSIEDAIDLHPIDSTSILPPKYALWDKLSEAYELQGRIEESLEALEKAYDEMRKALGDENERTFVQYEMLIKANMNYGFVNKARSMAEDDLKRSRKKYGEDHRITISKYVATGNLIRTTSSDPKDIETAIAYLKKVYKYYRKAKVEDRLQFNALFDIANALENCGEFEESNRLFEKAIDIGSGHYGRNHLEVIDCDYHMAANYLALKEYSKARSHVKRALRYRMKELGKNHIYTMHAVELEKMIKSKIGNNQSEKMEDALQEEPRINLHQKVIKELKKIIELNNREEYTSAVKHLGKVMEENKAFLSENLDLLIACKVMLMELYISENRHQEAIAVFEDLVKNESDYLEENYDTKATMLRMVGVCYLQEKDTGRAKTVLNDALCFYQSNSIKYFDEINAIEFILKGIDAENIDNME